MTIPIIHLLVLLVVQPLQIVAVLIKQNRNAKATIAADGLLAQGVNADKMWPILFAFMLSFTQVNDTVRITTLFDNTKIYEDSMCTRKIDIIPKGRTFYSWHSCNKKSSHQVIRVTDTVYLKNFDVDKWPVDMKNNSKAELILSNSELPVSTSKSPSAPMPTSTPTYNTGYHSGSRSSGSSSSGCSSTQCTGRTKKGNRCGRMTTNCSGRCYQH